MEQFTSNGSDTANPLLKEPNPTVLYLILRKERQESGRRKTGKLSGKTGEGVRNSCMCLCVYVCMCVGAKLCVYCEQNQICYVQMG